MTIDYRARATKAEQANAELSAALSRRPKHDAFVEQIKVMLKLDKACPYNQVIQKIKQLTVNQELYAAGSNDRRDLNQEKKLSFEEGRKQGLLDAIEKIKNG
ncbi:hypothetical protein Fifi067_00078 [Erwinia phage Fifi067]|nr:hypothetical protein Fifi067_00078 [Erwinia phage Fifi067]